MTIKPLLGFLLTLLSYSVFGQGEKPYNVLFIISDDLTANAVSCYGNPLKITPNIDKLATEGMRFDRAYSQFPICGPSRASFMSGYYPHATGTFGYTSGREHIGPDKVTWSQLFKNNGYYTARVSKIYHMGVPIDIEKGSDGADDEASWMERFNSQGPEWQAEGEAELVQNNPYGELERKGGNVMTIVKADGDDLVHSDGRTAEKASQLIKEHKDKPFFLAVGLVRPHVPFVAPANYFEAYPYQEMILPPKVMGDWNDIPANGINYVTSVNAQMSEDQEKKAIAGYYASVAYMDAQVGKVLATLKEEGLEDNTIVIFTSDHGFHLGQHDFWMKVSLHEESVKVPLIIKVPGQQAAVTSSFAELIDLYPTIAELAGLSLPNQIQGKSLVPIIENPKAQIREAAFSVSKWRGQEFFLLRSDQWAFIQYKEDASGGMELFDMKNDPQQFNNLAGNPQYAKVVEGFQEQLAKKLMEVRTNDLGISYSQE
ncbi:iduronate-2-sulfatase [Echinicola pacifica]|uniref:Iduronate-2-sulfatase n=1 Tax=Echinicola pacifica TaxID=346377 RepID=A0A918Q454_9BACT|nr:sulfatase [Echinicola pacifica]GGZ31534.1 iduronate-2-sulfatase [Echinicola pacifica]